ncbi:MAG: NB-ARC domain-containing protein [Crocosphaera sp.]|nr:NB-ARC domain-containing protein [Crocosphaera sp.]
MTLLTEKEKLFRELNEEHFKLLNLRYGIKPELFIKDIRKLLSSISDAGKVINDQEQRNQLEIYARYWDLFLYQNQSDDKYEETSLSEPEEPLIIPSNNSVHWGEAPVITKFEGRTEDLEKLKIYLEKNCQILTILGMGGVGKTFLARKLVEEIKERFDKIFWMRLINAPKLTEVLKEIIKFLSDYKETGEGTFDKQKSQLTNYLRKYKCLIILDNIEAILAQDKEAGQYKQGYENYQQLIELFGDIEHQSCLILTSREKPKTISALENPGSFVYSYILNGLEYEDAKKLLQKTVELKLKGSENDFKDLINQYQGIPLYLELVGKYISELYAGDINLFLNDKNKVFGDIRDFLDQHYNRLSEREKEIMNWLAIHRDPISLPELKTNIFSKELKIGTSDIIQSLKRRTALVESLEAESKQFSLQPVLIEYITKRLIDDIFQEIKEEKVDLLRKYPLIQAQAKDYLTTSQIRVILEPISDKLKYEYLSKETTLKEHLKTLVDNLRNQFNEFSRYAVGNIINLSRLLGVSLRGFDFSDFQIWQADLRDISLHDVNFSYADLQMCAFPQTFGSILSVAFSPNNKLLATSTASGEIYVWQVEDRQQLASFSGQHTQSVWDIAFSPDGKLFASGDDEGKVKIWDVKTRKCLNQDNNIKHELRVWSVAFAPDSKILATGGGDGTVKFWDVSNIENIQEIENNRRKLTGEVRAITFNPVNKKTIAVAHGINTLSLYNIEENIICELKHSNYSDDYRVWSLTFDAQGDYFASGSEDGTIKLWRAESGDEVKCFQINPENSPPQKDKTKKNNQKKVKVQSLAFNPNTKILVSGSDDNTIRFWDVETGQCLKTESEHKNRVWSVAFSSDGKILASGSDDRSVKIWDSDQMKCLYTWQGRGRRLLSFAFHPCDSNQIVSGGEDGIVRVWNIETETEDTKLKLKDKHTGRVWSVAFSSDGKILATGSDDCTIKLWDLNTGKCFRTLEGHCSWVWSVSFSPKDEILASASDDKNVIATGDEDNRVRIWNLEDEKLVLDSDKGHKDWVRAVCFSRDGQILASASEDRTIKLWNTKTNELVTPAFKEDKGHTGRVWTLAFNPNHKIIASGGDDNTVKLWNVNTSDCYQTLEEHKDWVRAVSFDSEGKRLASASEDGTIQIYELIQNNNTEEVKFSHSKSLNAKKPYESLKIWGVTGLTSAQKETLIELGAVDEY